MIPRDSSSSGIEEDGAPQVVGDVTQLRCETNLILLALHLLQYFGLSLFVTEKFEKNVQIISPAF
jgi:hypothetical protein